MGLVTRNDDQHARKVGEPEKERLCERHFYLTV
jgi:hypothetical protein